MATLTNRTALVTGASRGLGAGIATALARAGASVAVNYVHSEAKANSLCDALASEGARAQAFRADIRDEADVQRLMREVESAFGPIDIVVANATGDQQRMSIEEQNWQAYLQQMEFFVKSPLLLMQAVLPQWKARKFGRFIQIGSEVVELGNPKFAHYVAAKGAQLAQTRSWARELGPDGITVNLIAPGWIPTERAFNATAEDRTNYLAGVPLPQSGTPQNIGDAVVFLASDAGSFITGQKLAVNGGNTLE
ncbi:MAG: SDR family oxidoreductase [Acidobacteria bacterium]|nr:SDR family oxidoreductase [Acidobacteriota bacterium]